jgi:hypothetical protein
VCELRAEVEEYRAICKTIEVDYDAILENRLASYEHAFDSWMKALHEKETLRSLHREAASELDSCYLEDEYYYQNAGDLAQRIRKALEE